MPILTLFLLALTPQQAAIRALADQDLRVATIGARLARAGGDDLCPGQHLSTAGLALQDAAQYSPAVRGDAIAALNLGTGPTVVGLSEETAGSGVQLGDVVLRVDGRPVAPATRAAPYAAIVQVEDAIEAASAPVALEVQRAGATVRVTLQPVRGCRSRFQIVRGGLGATQADGTRVQLSDAMLALAANDDALAALLAHEVSHNILRHTVLKTPSKQSEYEADRLSVTLVARAGYDLDAVLPFWKALRKRSDYGIFADGTHPGWQKRLAALAAAVDQARAQRAAGLPLEAPPQEDASQPPKGR